MIKEFFRDYVDRLKRTNLEVFGTDEKLNYRIVHKERLEKAQEDKWPLD